MLGCSAPDTGPLQHAISIVVPSHYLHLDKRFAEESASKSAGPSHSNTFRFINPAYFVGWLCEPLESLELDTATCSTPPLGKCCAVLGLAGNVSQSQCSELWQEAVCCCFSCMGLRPPSDRNPARTAQDTQFLAAVSMNWSDEDNTWKQKLKKSRHVLAFSIVKPPLCFLKTVLTRGVIPVWPSHLSLNR